ncbi:MAG: hypothetical protein JW891_10670 [Candidatus Lokiarchaeota archaeon]|nr:hypothetical protein [Candidatus Lokiarchaeota archaeon]
MANFKQKLLSMTIVSILMLSFATPLVAAAGENLYDHSFAEEYWDVSYDFLGFQLEEDYKPGVYNGTATHNDSITDVDSKFYQTYTNVGGVQSLYIAMQNFSWDLDNGYNSSEYACAPFQLLVQHFNPGGDPATHLFVVNRFLGLMAYYDYKTDPAELPSNRNHMFLGWSFYSGYHRLLLNERLNDAGAPSWMHVDPSIETEAIPINLKKTTTSTGAEYSYGMSYKNVFTLWQPLSVSAGLDSSSTNLGNIVAASVIEELNFTYITTIDNGKVTTRVKYNIGEMTNLWVFSQWEEIISTAIGGDSLNLGSGYYLGYYNNSAGGGIGARLSGFGIYPGFSLAVINTVNIMRFNIDEGSGSEIGFQNSTGSTIGQITHEIPAATCYINGHPVYKLNFDETSNYTLDGTEEHESTTFVVGRGLVSTPINFGTILGFGAFIAGFIGNLTETRAGIRVLLAAYILSHLSSVSVGFYYVTCFPDWAGGTIEQDPTFTAYTSAITGENGGIPGYEPWLIGLAGLCGISFVLYRIRKKKL